jgi:archaemetzincin
MSESIGIVQLGPTLEYPVEDLTAKLATRFPGYHVRRLDATGDPAMAFDSSRNQYHSTRVLVALEESPQADRVARILGIVAFDLYVPGMNFVFGEARCPGRAAVISTYRLKPDDDDPGLFESRIVKEAVHEIGHMLGLKHCPKSSCVMYFSERIADTDRKRDSFCLECRPKVKLLEIE